MKKLTLQLFTGLIFLFGILLCVSVMGCGNTVGGNNNDEGKNIIIKPFSGEATYDKSTKTVKFPSDTAWKNFILSPTEAKDKFICVEYSNLKGGIDLYVDYDDGNNNFWSGQNTKEAIVSYKNKIYLQLEEVKIIGSKKIQIRLQSRTAGAEVKIEKIYFTDEKIEDKSLVIDEKSDENAVEFDTSISAINLVKNMSVGFNLGNCFDAYQTMNDPADILWDGVDEWKEPKMSKAVLQDLADKFGKDEAGKSNAKTIRIPVTWFNHIIDDEYTIDPYWMEEIKRVVDIAYSEGYYVILNSHHDVRGVDENTHPPMSNPLKYHEGYILRDNQVDIEESKRFLKAVWTQICKTFNNSYGEHLIFETMNEPRNTADEHWGVDKYCSECLAEARLNNEFNQLVLDTIRASGGNNAKRFVMIPNVGCDRDSGLDEVFKMPTDTASDKLILTVHWYPLDIGHLWKTQSWDLGNMESVFSDLNTNFVEKGIPVVIGEVGPSEANFENLVQGKSDEEKNIEALKPLSDLSKLAGKYGMSVLIFHLGELKRVIDGKYLPELLVEDWKNSNEENDKEIIIGDNYYIEEGKGSYDTSTQTLNLTQQYADFALTPEYEAKDKYLCIEYENLKGDITLYVAYDDGDNNWDNPFDSIELNPTNTKVILKLDESKMIASKKMKIKWQRKNENGDTEIKINKIYFTSGDSC